ncbi:MAG: ATP-dependent DNA helicase RecG, partial [Gammaproteobacteria bacterium]|nr:ATP-dependent DNA helicase RecG [Gammaproteobacteria bacterium]
MDIPKEQQSITALRGVGAALAQRLAVLGVERVQDLLFVLPTRYEDRTRIQPIGSVLAGTRAVIEGQIQLTEVVYRRRRQLLCRLADGSGFLTLRFFHFSSSQQQGLARGATLRCFGEIRRGPMGLEMVHPEYQRLYDANATLEEVLTPIYPLTEGVSQARLRSLIKQAMKFGVSGIKDWLPAEMTRALGLPALGDALRIVHEPPRDVALEELDAGCHPAQRRLAFEELLTHQV